MARSTVCRWKSRSCCDFILREAGSGTYEHVRAALHSAGVEITKLNSKLEMGTSEAVAIAVQQGLGVGFASRMIVEKICRDRVVAVPIKGVSIQQQIFVGRQTFLPSSRAQAAFWAFLQEHAGELMQAAAMDMDLAVAV